MTNSVIPENLILFVLDKIESVTELEALLILRQDANRKWGAPVLAERLYISQAQTAELLRALCDKGFTIADERQEYRYCPDSPELDLLVDGLAKIYLKHIVPVTDLIHSKPKYKVQGFADAFKLRKDDEE
jgi:biotin operon repressor